MSGLGMEAVGLALLHFLWQGASLTALLWLALRFTGGSRTRYGLGLAALAAMALCVPVTLEYLSLSLVREVSLGRPVLPPLPLERAAASTSLLTWLVWIWCGGVCVFAARSFGGWLMLQKMRRAAQEAVPAALLERFERLRGRLGIQRVVGYAVSGAVDAPAVAGWFRPVVLIPLSALSGLSVEQLEAVMVHELAHIRRSDAAVNVFQIALETLLFYHPAVWWVSRMVRAERENCCDDVAVAVCGNAADYARALTAMSGAPPAWAMCAHGGLLKARVERLLGMKKLSHPLPRTGFFALAFLGACCLALAGAMYPQDTPVAPRPPVAPAAPAESSIASARKPFDQQMKEIEEQIRKVEAQVKELERRSRKVKSLDDARQVQELQQRVLRQAIDIQEIADKIEAEAADRAAEVMRNVPKPE